MPTTSELFKKHEQNKLFCTNCGVPEDVRMVKISPGLDLLHYSTQPSEKNFLTVLSIRTGQKTTCINNCPPRWSRSKQSKKDGQRLDTHTALAASVPCNPVYRARLTGKMQDLCKKFWYLSGLYESIV